MIDVHTHICEFQDRLEIDRYFTTHGSLPAATLDAYIAAIDGAERAVLLALDAKPAGFYMSNARRAVGLSDSRACSLSHRTRRTRWSAPCTTWA